MERGEEVGGLQEKLDDLKMSFQSKRTAADLVLGPSYIRSAGNAAPHEFDDDDLLETVAGLVVLCFSVLGFGVFLSWALVLFCHGLWCFSGTYNFLKNTPIFPSAPKTRISAHIGYIEHRKYHYESPQLTTVAVKS